MPSHIFVQVGAWDDVVASNERAWAASRAWVKARAAPATELSFHSLGWLQYGYLQQGRYVASRALLDSVDATLAGIDWGTSEAIDARYAAEQLRFSYARETGDWTVYGGRPPERMVGNVKLTSERARIFAASETYWLAFVAAMLGDSVRANEMAASLPASRIIARAQIAALVAKTRGDTATWIAQLETAAKAEEAVVHFGPPNVAPSHELLGDALLARGRAREAIAAYERSSHSCRTARTRCSGWREPSGQRATPPPRRERRRR